MKRQSKTTGNRIVDRDIDAIYTELERVRGVTEEPGTIFGIDPGIAPVEMPITTTVTTESGSEADGIQVRRDNNPALGPRKQLHFIAGANVSLSAQDDGEEIDITINATGGGGTPSNTVTDVGSTSNAGVATTYSRGDHTHRGVRSVKRVNGTPYYGDVDFHSVDPLYWEDDTNGPRIGIDLTGGGGNNNGPGIVLVGGLFWRRIMPTYNSPGWTVIQPHVWERNAFTLASYEVAHAVAWEVLTPFQGPGLVNLWLTFLDAINTGHTNQIDLTVASTRGTSATGRSVPNTDMHTGVRDFTLPFTGSQVQRIRITANPAMWDLSNLTQGTVKIWLLSSKLW
ncbi:MAG: hypothetical protein QXI19_05835 [Candidatus Caldarchaeum sp.]